MPLSLSEPVRRFIDEHRVARLATADAAARPHVIPFCYAFDGQHLYFVVDHKPKRRTDKPLKRIQNMLENPRAAVVIDDYDDDWTKLAYVLLRGDTALVHDRTEYERILALLRERYPQYRDMPLTFPDNAMVRITPTRVNAWGRIEEA